MCRSVSNTTRSRRRGLPSCPFIQVPYRHLQGSRETPRYVRLRRRELRISVQKRGNSRPEWGEKLKSYSDFSRRRPWALDRTEAKEAGPAAEVAGLP